MSDRDSTLAAHAAVYFACGAGLGGGADILVSRIFDPATGTVAGLAGFAFGLLLARVITRRWFPD